MESDDVGVVRVPDWEKYVWLRHGFSTRIGALSTVYGRGDLNLGWTKDDDPELVAGNRRLLLEAVGWGAAGEMVTLRQVHGPRVLVVAEGEAASLVSGEGRAVAEADGLMTSAPGVMLAVQAADCVPVLVADVRQRVVAAFHAGWRGTAAGIVELGVVKMMAEFGSEPGDLVGAVGPAIGACCYVVGEEVREQFGARFGYAADLFREREDGLRMPILMLTAKTQEAEKVMGLELGADDYMTKPFGTRELRARIKALLRRAAGDAQTGSYRFGEVEVNFGRGELLRRGIPQELTPIEFRMLGLFIRARGRVLSRDQLLDGAWGPETYASARIVDNHIANLRRKIEPDPANPRYLRNVRGLGYRFDG